MKARKFIVKAESFSWHSLFNSHWTALSLRIWRYVTSALFLSASCAQAQTGSCMLPSLIWRKVCQPSCGSMRGVWCEWQEANSCICIHFAPWLHLLILFLPSTLRNSWCQLQSSERHESLWAQCQLCRVCCLAPFILRSCRRNRWASVETVHVDASGQRDFGERCLCNSPADWSSQPIYGNEEVLFQVRDYSSSEKSNSLISKGHAVLLHLIAAMKPSETLQIAHEGAPMQHTEQSLEAHRTYAAS